MLYIMVEMSKCTSNES